MKMKGVLVLKCIFSETTYFVYLGTKFQVFSTILISFREGCSCTIFSLFPLSHCKKLTQLTVHSKNQGRDLTKIFGSFQSNLVDETLLSCSGVQPQQQEIYISSTRLLCPPPTSFHAADAAHAFLSIIVSTFTITEPSGQQPLTHCFKLHSKSAFTLRTTPSLIYCPPVHLTSIQSPVSPNLFKSPLRHTRLLFKSSKTPHLNIYRT